MPKKETNEESALEATAKKIGKAAGRVAAAAGVLDASPSPKADKPGKLQKKNKSRLPRKEKKALQKANARQQ